MKSLLRLFLLATLLASGPFAKASLVSSINYTSCGANCPPLTFVNSAVADGSALSFSNAYGGAFSQAAYGTLKASADSSYSSTPSAFSISSAVAQFSDWITLGGLTGPQMVTFILHTDGSLGGAAGSANAVAGMSLTLDVDGNEVAIVADYFGNQPALPSASQGGLSGTFALEYGTQISIKAILGVTGILGGFAHFGDTVGLEIIAPPGTTIESESGAAYRLTTVPEPASAALLMLGFATLLATRNRYRRA